MATLPWASVWPLRTAHDAAARPRLALLGHDHGPPRCRAGAKERVPVPGRDVGPTLSLLVADQFAYSEALLPPPGAEAAHRRTTAVPLGGQGGDAIAAGAKALRGRMQAPRRHTDPAHNDLAPTIAEAADATRKILHKSKLALAKRHGLEWLAVVVQRPAGKADRRGAMALGHLVLDRQQRCQQRTEEKTSGRSQSSWLLHAGPRRMRSSSRSITAVDSRKAIRPIASCHQVGGWSRRPTSR